MIRSSSTEQSQRLYILVIAGAIALRAATFLMSTNYGADSISRSLIAYYWSQHSFFIWHPNPETSVWLPLPFYINGVILMIWDNFSLAPRVVSLVLSMASLAAFYMLSRRLFSKEVSLAALACFAVYTLHMKHGNIASSESLFIFSVLAVMYFFERLRRRQRWFIVAGLSLSLLAAVMTRFETWLLPPFLIVAAIASRRHPDDPPRSVTVWATIIASVLPGLFMLSWMYGSYREFGDALYSLNLAAAEHADLTAVFAESGGRLRVILYNAAFWPGVLLIGLSPLIFVSGLWGMVRTVTEKRGIIWVVFIALILGTYYYKSTVTHELAPLARYTILPGTIMCLFAAPGIYDLAGRVRSGKPRRIIFTVLLTGLISAVLLSGNYINSNNPRFRKLAAVSSVTRYPRSLSPVIELLEKQVQPTDKVIFSMADYASNPIVMYSGIRPDQVIPVSRSNPDDIIEKMGRLNPTLLVLHRDSPLYQHLGAETYPDFFTIRDKEWSLDTIAGDFGIYRAAL